MYDVRTFTPFAWWNTRRWLANGIGSDDRRGFALIEHRQAIAFALMMGVAIALAALSWTPGSYMVRTGVLSGRLEHVLAYGGTTLLLLVVSKTSREAWCLASGCALLSCLLELGQLWVPGRHADIRDALASCGGIMCATCLHQILPGKWHLNRLFGGLFALRRKTGEALDPLEA